MGLEVQGTAEILAGALEITLLIAGDTLVQPGFGLRRLHGYPLETSWGTPLHPSSDREAAERIKLLTTENAQLRAEIGSIKDRLQNVERIVTDQPIALAKEIDALAIDKGGRA